MKTANLYSAYKTDPDLESGKGVLIDLGLAKFLVHRAGGANQAFVEMMNKRKKPLERQINAGTLDNDVASKLMAEVYSHTVVKGWQGVTDENGVAIDFTPAACAKLLLDLPDLFRVLQEETSRIANFQQESVAANSDALKNA